jgi:hypothetical protein
LNESCIEVCSQRDLDGAHPPAGHFRGACAAEGATRAGCAGGGAGRPQSSASVTDASSTVTSFDGVASLAVHAASAISNRTDVLDM